MESLLGWMAVDGVGDGEEDWEALELDSRMAMEGSLVVVVGMWVGCCCGWDVE